MLHYFALLLPSFVCSFWVITMLSKTNIRPQKIWIITMFVIAISTFIWSVYFAGIQDYSLFYKLNIIETFTTLSYYPLVYLHLKSMTTEKTFGKKKYFLFLPTIVIGGAIVFLYLEMGDKYAVQYIQNIIESHGKPLIFNGCIHATHHIVCIYLYNLVIVFQAILVFVFILYLMFKNYATRDGSLKTTKNVRLILCYLFSLLIFSLIASRGYFFYTNHPVIVSTILTFWAIIIYYIGYNVYQSNFSILLPVNTNPVEEDTVPEENNPELTELMETKSSKVKVNIKKKQLELVTLFTRMIEEDKIYLQSNLRLGDVARMMRTNRTYLSRMINKQYNCTFSDFINRKRIQFAQELMLSNNKLTQEQIAEQSGFVHTSTFSRTFKQQAGITFREWQKKHTR